MVPSIMDVAHAGGRDSKAAVLGKSKCIFTPKLFYHSRVYNTLLSILQTEQNTVNIGTHIQFVSCSNISNNFVDIILHRFYFLTIFSIGQLC